MKKFPFPEHRNWELAHRKLTDLYLNEAREARVKYMAGEITFKEYLEGGRERLKVDLIRHKTVDLLKEWELIK